MAVIDVYANSIVEDAKSSALGVGIPSARTHATFGGRGSDVVEMIQLVTITNGDSAGSVYRLFNAVPSQYILDDIEILNPAIAGASDCDLGLYETDYGDVVDANIIGDGLDLTSANLYPDFLHGADNIALADRVKMLRDLAAIDDFQSPHSFDLALTLNSGASATGVVLVRARFINPVS